MKKPQFDIRKIYNKSFWGLSTVFFGILTTIFVIAVKVTPQSSNFINEFLNINPYERVETGESIPFNEYKSDFVNPDGSYDHISMRKNSEKIALDVATEGSVLLWNDNDALPLKKDSNISVFGISSNKYLFSAAGSGHLGVSTTSSLDGEFKERNINLNPDLVNAYKFLGSQYGNTLSTAGQTLDGVSIGDKCYVEYGINEVPWNKLNTTQVGNVTDTIEDYGDAALLLISRNDGEDGDTNYNTKECIDGNYLDLAFEEEKILNELEALKEQGKVKKIVLVINAAQPMQMEHILDHDIDSCLWVGVGGTMSFEQIASVVSGESNPSGKTIDTYAYNNYSNPATVNFGDFEFANKSGLPTTTDYSHSEKYLTYAESIYVGYRYYETRYEDYVLNRGNARSTVGSTDNNEWKYSNEVAFPFGYGNSYTTFEHTDFKVKNVGDDYKVSVTIKNTGKVAGKDVAQIYLQKPYTQYDIDNVVEKSTVELVGFEKTKLLNPNESQTLEIDIDDTQLRTYDAYNKKTYILEKGNYYLAEGENAHDALNNILSKKGKTVSDGMDKEGDSSKVHEIKIKDDDFVKYSRNYSTNHPITNQFDDADVKLYEGVKDQFNDFKYLSRSDWNGTYPKPVTMDCLTDKMRYDMQYTHDIVEDPTKKMPKYGQQGTAKLVDYWGLKYNDPLWETLLDQLSWEEMNILATEGGGLAGAASIDAPKGLAKDGPGGIGVGNPTVMCFPSECNMGSTFNKQLIEDLGNAFGMEIMHVGYHGIYGPGANIHRSPYSGRNREYFSEDPYISSVMLAKEVKGLQNRGIIVFTKHFLLNDSERNRYGVAVFANEQTIREIYLQAFEKAVVESKMNGVMSSFNRIGCIWSGKHKGLLTEVLRNEWGFIGVVQTDAYVGTHMHAAIGESLIAGNDFTMGGAVSNKFDQWKDSPTLVSALRETCHRILYTKANSCTMNGMSATTKIIYHTPWWQIALQNGEIISAVLVGVSGLLLILSFVLPVLRKRKERLEIEKGAKLKYFFDIISKKVAIGGIVIGSLGIILGTATPFIYKEVTKPLPIQKLHECESICPSCGKCQDYDCNYVVCLEKCDCPCEHSCPVCEGCLDVSSSEERCLIKCGHDKANKYEFEGEDNHVLLYEGMLGPLGIASEPGATEHYVSGFNANLGARIKYVFNSPSEQIATLSVSVSKRSAGQLFTNNIITTINKEILSSKAIVPALTIDEPEWVTFVEVTLGCIKLKEGRNVIEFTVANDDVASGFNFDKLSLASNEEILWYEGEHICDHVCDICGLCQDEKCLDAACKEKCTCNIHRQVFSSLDEEVIKTNTSVEDNAIKIVNNSEVKYELRSNQKMNPYLFLRIKQNSELRKLEDYIDIEVNSKLLSVNSTIEIGEEYQEIKLGKINLEYGNNIINIKGKKDGVLLKELIIGDDDEVTYIDPYEFGVDDERVLLIGNAYKSNDHYIDMAVENPKDSEITFQIDSSKATETDLYFELGCRQGTIYLKDIFEISLNDEIITTPEQTLSNNGRDLVEFAQILIGKVNLKEGKNTIKIKTLFNDPDVNTTLRNIYFRGTDAKLEYSKDSISMNRLVYEAETATINKVGGNPSVAYGNNSSGDQFLGGVNDVGVTNPGEASIVLNINSSKEGFAKFYVAAGCEANMSANALELYLNNTKITSSQTWSKKGWYGWNENFHSNLYLNEGNNEIKLIIQNGATMNIDYFVFESLFTIER